MSVGFDPNADFETVADGTEAITLLRRGTSAQVAVSHALRRAVSLAEVQASYGRYVREDTRWHFPAAELVIGPRAGDVILDGDETRWTVLDVQKATLSNRWRCIGRDVAIVYHLDDHVTILQATYAKEEGGAAEPTWRTWRTQLRARIQPQDTDIAVEHEARRARTRVSVYIEGNLELTQRHRVRAADGTIYKIVSVTNAELIGELQTIEAEAVEWPHD